MTKRVLHRGPTNCEDKNNRCLFPCEYKAPNELRTEDLAYGMNKIIELELEWPLRRTSTSYLDRRLTYFGVADLKIRRRKIVLF